MSKDLAAKCNQINNERLQINACEIYKIYLKKKTKKCNKMVVNDKKNLPEDKKQNLVEYRKN